MLKLKDDVVEFLKANVYLGCFYGAWLVNNEDCDFGDVSAYRQIETPFVVKGLRKC